MSSESLDQRLSKGVGIEYYSMVTECHEHGRIVDMGDSQLTVLANSADSTEKIDQEQITSITEPSSNQMSREDVPEKPGYEREIDENIDSSLADALKTVSIAGEDYLEALFAAELGSFRLERGVYDDE